MPFRATVQTPTGLKIAQKGFTEAELFDGRLPNKFDDPRDKMKRTRAPAVQASFVEVDTTEAAEAQAVPPPFSQADLAEGEHAATIVAADQFYSAGFEAPTWKDEVAVRQTPPPLHPHVTSRLRSRQLVSSSDTNHSHTCTAM